MVEYAQDCGKEGETATTVRCKMNKGKQVVDRISISNKFLINSWSKSKVRRLLLVERMEIRRS